MKRIVVTGANGFIGTNLVNCALEKGVEVIALVFPGTKCNFIVSDLLQIVEIDIKEITKLPSLIKKRGFDCFYHFAWMGVYEPDSLNYEIQISNILCTCEATKIAKEIGCKKFIYPSSVMEYDCMRSSSSIDGLVPNKRTSYYGAKMGAYLLSKHLASQIGIEYIEAIISNIYGPTLNPGFITSTLLKFIKGEHASFSSGEQFYDFVHIRDAALSLYYVGAEGKAFTSYYIGSNNPRKLKYFIMDMRDCVDPNIQIGLGEINTTVVDMNLNYFDTQKVAKETNYKQTIEFKDGINMTIKWLKENM